MALSLKATDKDLSRILDKVWNDDRVDERESHALMRISDGVVEFIKDNPALREVQDKADQLVDAYKAVVKQTDASALAIPQDELQRVVNAVEWQVAYVVIAWEALQRELMAMANRPYAQ